MYENNTIGVILITNLASSNCANKILSRVICIPKGNVYNTSPVV